MRPETFGKLVAPRSTAKHASTKPMTSTKRLCLLLCISVLRAAFVAPTDPSVLIDPVPDVGTGGGSFRLSATLGDHMVLEAAPKSAIVWGFAAAGTTVTTTLGAHTVTSVADSTGVWRARSS